MRISRSGAAAAAVVVAATLFAALRAPSPAAAITGASPVLEKRIIGYSVQHRPIVAYHLGNPRLRRVTMILGQMHGDEHAGIRVASALINGTRSIEGLNLWVIPTLNPDGDVRSTRQNAHRVDLNRNWPDHWAHLTGQYYSGPGPLSEPETRAVRLFLLRIRPAYLVSLHQPLYGVDSTDGGRLDPAFRNRLAANLGLPVKPFRCWGFCHGSMTGWYTTHHYGTAITIEFGWSPTAYMLSTRAPNGIVAALGGRFGPLAAHNPLTTMAVRSTTSLTSVYGWAWDTDHHAAHLYYRAYRDGVYLRPGSARFASPALRATRGVPYGHRYGFTDRPRPGAHTYCIVVTNVGAGTADTRTCRSVVVPAPATPSP